MSVPIDTLYLLEQFYEVIRSGQHFLHAHHYSAEEGSLYSDLGSAARGQVFRARRLSPLPKSRPFNLIFYRQAFHHHLASNADFITGLAGRKRNLDLYFRDMEKIIRLTFDELVEQGEMGRAVLNHTSYQIAYAVTRHLPYWYFRGLTLSATIAHLTGGDAYDSEMMGRMEDALWAIDLACAYTAAYLEIDFHASHIVMADKGPWACEYSTQQCNIVFEAGYHLARHITTQVSPYLEALGANHSQLTSILCDELSLVAMQQAHSALVPDLNQAATIGLLVRDAVEQYEPTLLYNLKKRCEELNARQQEATYAMQQALSGTVMLPLRVGPMTTRGAAAAQFEATGVSHQPPAEEGGDFRALFRDLEVETGQQGTVEAAPQALSEKLGMETNASVIEAGETIIEYLKKMTFSGPDREEKKDIADMSGSAGGGSEDDDKQDREKQEEELFNEMEFDTVVQGQGKAKRKMQQLLQAIQAGLQITFASQMQAKAFAKAAMVHEPEAAGAINEQNMRFVEKGQVQSVSQDQVQAMRKETEPQAQKKQQALKQQEQKQDKEAEKDARKEQRQEHKPEQPRPGDKQQGESSAQKLAAKPGRNTQNRLKLRMGKIQASLNELKESKQQGVSVKEAKKSSLDKDGDGVPDFKPVGRGR